MRLSSLVLVALLSVGSAGCAKTGSVTEKTPVADLGAYGSAAVAVDVPPTVKNAAQHQSTLTNALVERLRSKRFDVVASDGAALLVKVKVVDLDEGSQLARGLNAGGESKVALSVELVDAKQSKPVGSFDVTGNSSKNTHTSINGLDTGAIEDTTSRALEAAADQIAEFLEQHRKK